MDRALKTIKIKKMKWFWWVHRFIAWRFFEFAGVPFILLKWSSIRSVWSVLYFSGFWYFLLFSSASWWLGVFANKSTKLRVEKKNN